MAKTLIALQLFYIVGNQPAINVLHFRSVDEPSENDPDTEAKAVITAWIDSKEDEWMACLPAGTKLIGYKARQINNGGGPTVSKPRNIPGTRTGEMSTSGIGPCIIWGFQKAGGGWANGKTFLPGVSETDIGDNLFSSELLTNCDLIIDSLLAIPALEVSGTGGYEFVIYSPTTESSSGVETGGVSGKPGVQNGRMRPSF